SFYGLGAPLGGLVGLVFGGVVADAFGWRSVFLIAGVPGLLLALLLWLTLKEPRRSTDRSQTPTSSIGETLKVLAGKPTYWLVCGGSALSAFLSLGHGAFLVSFFLRNHPDEVSAVAAS